MVDPIAVGDTFEVPELSWDERDVLLYALGVGAGQADPLQELELTVERDGRPPSVLPTFGVAMAHRATELVLANLDLRRILHAEQSVALDGPLPASASARVRARVQAVYDKGSGALIVIDATTSDRRTGAPLLRSRSSIFLTGAGGFGGDRGPSSAWSAPGRAPDHILTAPTRPDQALVYRLSGDRNPLHADPAFARRAGFDRPILHGLCTYGITARMLLHATCASEPARLRAFSARFSAPVVPGDTLTIEAWEVSREEVVFRTAVRHGSVVLDHGRLRRTVAHPPAP